MLKKYQKRAIKYLSKHPDYNGFVHTFAGIGIGIMITYPFVKDHPVRWATFFIFLSVLGHLWAAEQEK